MEKGKFTFTKESALQEVDNFIESFKEMKIVNLGNDTYRVFGVLDTSIEQEIQNVFGKAGELLYCEQLIINDLQETELTIVGECSMLFKREKQIDEQKKVNEIFRLHDMLRMGFYGAFDSVGFKQYYENSYNDEFDIVTIPFELGKICNKE